VLGGAIKWRGRLQVALSLTTGLVPPAATNAIRATLRRFG